MSGRARPLTRRMMMNGAPRNESSVSTKGTSGTGTSLCAATKRIAAACFGRSYTVKTGQSLISGRRRATIASVRPSCVRSNSSVSLDMPVPSGIDTGPTVAA
jgi:hypothetical protein